jgi:hypothetical protein
VSEVAAIVFSTLACHFKVLAELGLVGVGQILQLLLGSDTGRVLCFYLVLIKWLTEAKASKTWITG